MPAKLFILPLLFSTFGLFAATPIDQQAIGQHIKQLIANTPSNTNMAIVIQSIRSGKMLYQRNADRYYLPASTVKTITATAALLYLGKQFRFQTAFSTDHKINQQGVINGNLYLRFQGDPTFTSEDLQQLLVKLKQAGLKKITGNLYLVAHDFAGKPYGHGWMWDDVDNCFSAPVNALMINHNCFSVGLRSGRHIGKATQVETIDDLHYTPLINHSVVAKKNKNAVNYCSLNVDVSANNTYTLTGCLKPRHSIDLAFAIRHIDHYASAITRDLLQQTGIKLIGHIIVSAANQRGKWPLASHQSAPLPELVKTLLLKSDNTLADSLLKTIGARYYQRRGNRRNGIMAIRKILHKRLGLSLKQDNLVDGSGLSRYNLLQPQALTQLLYYNFHQPSIGSAFMDALPLTSTDAGLKFYKASKQALLVNNIRVKSGIMHGIFSVTGYLMTEQKHIYAFAIMVNNFPGKKTPYYLLTTHLFTYLINHA